MVVAPLAVFHDTRMSTTSELLRTPLYQWHTRHNGRMVDFAGWSMPVQYTSIIEEHTATRTAVGLFDVSHMGRFRFADPGAGRFLETLTTRRVWPMETGKIRYSLMTREDGGVLDDVLVYHLEDLAGQPFCFMVVNASNRGKIHDWLQQHENLEQFGFEDQTRQTAMIAIQGPRALEAVESCCARSPGSLKYYHGMMSQVCGVPAIISRTGYTGEDGCELTVPAESAEEIWSTVLEQATPSGGRAVGLAARDTLRLEAAMPLYGHELDEDRNAADADIGFAINLKDREFPGRDAIAAARQNPDTPRRVGLLLEGKRPAREHSQVFQGQRPVGQVTSGTFSPTLQKPIAMAYVESACGEPGSRLEIDVRGKRLAAIVSPLPFYQRS